MITAKKKIYKCVPNQPVLSQWPIPSHRQKRDPKWRELAEPRINPEPDAHYAPSDDADEAALVVADAAPSDDAGPKPHRRAVVERVERHEHPGSPVDRAREAPDCEKEPHCRPPDAEVPQEAVPALQELTSRLTTINAPASPRMIRTRQLYYLCLPKHRASQQA